MVVFKTPVFFNIVKWRIKKIVPLKSGNNLFQEYLLQHCEGSLKV